jgi:transcriptional antiterminator RfaH
MSFWACCQLEPHRERLALHCLQEVAGYEVYLPRIKAKAAQGRHSKASHGSLLRPLFPGYAFIVIVNGWWSARWSPGVTRIVLDGTAPARVPDAVIDEIRARERNGVVILPERGLRRGDHVRITHGPFREFVGLYAGMRSRERVEVLLSLLGGQHRVTLPKDDIEPCRG